jgi:hypothetical protein
MPVLIKARVQALSIHVAGFGATSCHCCHEQNAIIAKYRSMNYFSLIINIDITSACLRRDSYNHLVRTPAYNCNLFTIQQHTIKLRNLIKSFSQKRIYGVKGSV